MQMTNAGIFFKKKSKLYLVVLFWMWLFLFFIIEVVHWRDNRLWICICIFFFMKILDKLLWQVIFILWKQQYKKNCLVSTSKIVENKDIFVMNTNYNFLSFVLSDTFSQLLVFYFHLYTLLYLLCLVVVLFKNIYSFIAIHCCFSIITTRFAMHFYNYTFEILQNFFFKMEKNSHRNTEHS